MKASVLLRQLEKLKNVYGGDDATQKLDLLSELEVKMCQDFKDPSGRS